MRGVILAGGAGRRLHPLTALFNKHLLPVYDRAMVEFPLRTLLHLGIRDICIVTGSQYVNDFDRYLSISGVPECDISFAGQKSPSGIADALAYAREFAGGDRITVILGDNIFGEGFRIQHPPQHDHARIWTKFVTEVAGLGVYDESSHTIREKETRGPGRAVVGLYEYPADVFDRIGHLTRSSRGELEITDLNNTYMREGKCEVADVGELYWTDAGTFDSLLNAATWAQNSVDNEREENRA